MSRRKPMCAYCGAPLGDEYMLRQFPSVAGKPEVGWHTSDTLRCVDADELYGKFPAAHGIALIRQLQAIEARGPGRLVTNKQWTQLNAKRD